MSSELVRQPLAELAANGATPMPHQKITTPPESGAAVKKTIDFESPVPHHDTVRPNSLNHRSVLLSPAFASPQNQLMESPTKFSEPIEDDRRKKKKKKEKKFDIASNEKPPYSYATLIGMSILSHPEKKLTLSAIYSWISDTFKYYRREDVGWQNSIRHNLSLNKAFIKGEKSKDGKGHFWCIEAGCEDQFLKSRNSKKSSYYEIMDQIYSSVKPHSANSIPSSPNYNYDDHNRQGEDNDALQPPTKRSRLLSASTEKGNLDSIPNLGAPFHHWGSSRTPVRLSVPQKGQNFVYHGSINESNSPLINDNLFNTPHLVVSESPNKPLLAGKNLTFTSSFSCNSNLELSPIRPNETGPLLEPLTPGEVYKAGAINHHIPNLHYTPSQTHHAQLPQTISKAANPQLNLARTPKSGLKTPIRTLRTPQANTSQRKLWNSPSYLDDFYYSPLVASQPALHSYDDDDMILRAFEAPANSRKSNSSGDSSRNLFNELKKADRTVSSASSSADVTDKFHQRSDSSTTEPDA